MYNYFIGISWFILSLIVNSLNDSIAKYLGTRLSIHEITFLRFLFSLISITPFIMYYGLYNLKTGNVTIHIFRGILIFLGITGWNYSLSMMPLFIVTVFNFTIPIFTIILSRLFLKESINLVKFFIIIVTFIGIVLTLNIEISNFDYKILTLIFSTIAFAALDIINKNFIKKESMISMLFYSIIVAIILTLPFAFQYWLTPTNRELILLFVLGINANLILFFLLKAFILVKATILAPYRYIELITSMITGYMFFSEVPTINTIYGSFIIIVSILCMMYLEKLNIDRYVENN